MLNIIAIFTVILIPFIELYYWGINIVNCSYSGVIYFALLILLTVQYRLYKKKEAFFWFSFFIWMWGTALINGGDTIKVFGGQLSRMWYLSTLIFLVGYLLKKEQRVKWIRAMLTVFAISSIILLSMVLYNATFGILELKTNIDEPFGAFRNGRLTAFGNANTLGKYTVTTILSAVWLRADAFYNNKKCLSIVSWILFIISIITLSLCRSRGAIVVSAVGIAVFEVLLFYKKINRKKQILDMLFILVISMTVYGLLVYMPKRIYDKTIINISSENITKEVEEKLTPYGLDYALDTMSDRTLIWPAVINMMNEKPNRWIIGVTATEVENLQVTGVYENRPELTAYNAHSAYLENLYLYGVPGAMLILFITVIWIKNSIELIFFKQAEASVRWLVIFIVAVLMLSFIEILAFPYKEMLPLTYIFYMAAGCISGRVDEE